MAWEKIGIFFGKRKKNGERRKNGVHLENTEDGRRFTALNPSGKAAKFSKELKDGVHYTNDGKSVKTDDKGKPLPLTKEQRKWRAGYISAQSDNAKAYNAKHKNR